MIDGDALALRHLEVARQELDALLDAMDSMGDLGRFLPDLRRVAAQMDADLDAMRAALEE